MNLNYQTRLCMPVISLLKYIYPSKQQGLFDAVLHILKRESIHQFLESFETF